VHEIGGRRRVFIQEAGALIFAKLHAPFAGFDGEFIEAHQLDATQARKVPKKDDRPHGDREGSTCAARPACVAPLRAGPTRAALT
jgi:hypothetical protein